MLTPEEQTAIDKASEFVLAFKGRGMTSSEARRMTLGLLRLFMHSAAGTAVMMTAMSQRAKREP